jgi:hypothetical protein
MAVGDVIVDIDQLTTGLTIDFQPAAGVEVLITGFSSEAVSVDAQFLQHNGTIGGFITKGDMFLSATGNPVFKFFINNTVYLRRYNNSGGNITMGYTGIQIK